jgi:hypothetical protein
MMEKAQLSKIHKEEILRKIKESLVDACYYDYDIIYRDKNIIRLEFSYTSFSVDNMEKETRHIKIDYMVVKY